MSDVQEPQNTEQSREDYEAELQELEAAEEREAEPAKTEYIEFVGEKPHGTQFYGTTGTHQIGRAYLRTAHDIDTPKDLEWKRGANGRFLVPVADMSPEVAELLANDPMFKRVSL